MEMIAPLAKVLAEANGIDWKKIPGTGDAGQVVEQDILNYLSRVMSGEEEPPSTPVDPPPADWTGEMPSMDMNMLAAAGVDSDIADFVASARNDGTADLSSDTMDFELELDEDEVADHPAVTRDPDEMAAAPRDADYAGAETVPAVDPSVLPVVPGGVDRASVPPVVTTPAVDPNPGYVEPSRDAPPHQPEETSGIAAASTGTGIAGGLLSSLYNRSEAPAAAPQPAPVEPARVEPAPVEPVRPEPVHVQPAPVEPPVVEPVVEPVVPAQPEPVRVEPVQPEPVSVEPVAPAPVEPVREVVREVVAPVAAPAPTPVAPPPVPTSPVVPVAPVAAPQADMLPAAMSRSYAALHLTFNAAALVAAQADLAEHFNRPAPLSVFVARAAARRLPTLGLGSVGVYGVGDEVLPIATPNLSADFRSAVMDVHGAEGGSQADLMVIDAGELGLDELELPGAGVTLALGRARGGTATLTLTGNVSVRKGATFLQGVAELLETPIRLML